MLASRCRVLAAAASGSFLGMSYTHMDEAEIWMGGISTIWFWAPKSYQKRWLDGILWDFKVTEWDIKSSIFPFGTCFGIPAQKGGWKRLIAPPTGWLKAYKADKPSINWCRISQPSTVSALWPDFCLPQQLVFRFFVKHQVSFSFVVQHEMAEATAMGIGSL